MTQAEAREKASTERLDFVQEPPFRKDVFHLAGAWNIHLEGVFPVIRALEVLCSFWRKGMISSG